MSDVVITTPANLQILRYNGTNWVNSTNNLDALSDVVITTPTTGQAVIYNGTNWVNTNNTLDGLSDVAITTPTTGQAVIYNGTNWVNTNNTLDGLSDVVITAPATNQVLSYNGTNWVNADTTSGSSNSLGLTDVPDAYGAAGQSLIVNSTGTGLVFADVGTNATGVVTINRQFVSGTTSSLAVNATASLNLTAAKTYALLMISVSSPAWVRLYTSTATRTSDAARLQTEDPLPDAGVIAEVITSTTNQVVLMSPATIGFSSETTPTTNVPIAITNIGTAAASITVTLTYIKMEG